MRHHFVKKYTKSEEIVFQYIPSTENIADILTKSLPYEATRKFASYLLLGQHNANASVQREY